MSRSVEIATDENGHYRHPDGYPLVVIFDSKTAKGKPPDEITWQEPVVALQSHELNTDTMPSKKSNAAPKPVKFVNTSRPKVRDRKSKRSNRYSENKKSQKIEHEVERKACDQDYVPARNTTLCKKLRTYSQDMLSVPCGSFSSLDPFALFPIYMEPYMYNLIHRYICITTEVAKISDSGHDPASKGYLPLAMTDAALFHALLCGTALYRDAVEGIRDSPEKCRHMTEAVHLLSARLQEAEPELSDSTLIAVAHLADFESSVGKFANWRLHMDGLHKMVQLRGGFESLNGSLKGKIWWADISGSVSTLSKPRFTTADLLASKPFPISVSQSKSDLCDGLSKLTGTFSLSNEFVDVLHELQYLTSALNNRSLNFLQINRFCTSIYCHLLAFQSTNNNAGQGRNLEEVYCIAALLYLKTIYDFHLCLKTPDLPAGAAVEEAMIQDLKFCLSMVEIRRAEARGFLLWILFLGGSAVSGTKDRAWFVARVARAIMEFQIHRFDDAKRRLKDFFWVDRIHGDSCRQLWDEAMVTVDVLFGSEN